MSMNIKRLNHYKEGFLEFLDILPIQQMENDIKCNHDQLIEYLYEKLNRGINETTDSRYKKIYHDLGICSIYTLIDPCYGDPVRWIFHGIKKSSFDLKAKHPRQWRVNNTHKSGAR